MPNLPTEKLNEMKGSDVVTMVRDLAELNSLGKPHTNKELEERISQYFSFCGKKGMRPGIEGLCLALSISRTTLHRWSHGQDCDSQRTEIISRAKQFIFAFLEQSSICGKLNPPVAIFLMKNWMSYKDSVTVESDQTERLPVPAIPEIERKYLNDTCDDSDPPKPEF